MQLGPMLKQLREFADLHIIEGSLVCDANNKQAVAVREYFGDKHILLEYAKPTEDERGWRTYEGLEAAMGFVERKLAALPGGGADVLFGFSQGSNLITCLCARAERGAPGAPPPFRAAVLLSPSRPGWAAQLPELFASPLATPTLMGFSDTDEVIGDGPLEVAKLWSPQCLRSCKHVGPGHRPLPSRDPAFVTGVAEFIAKFCPQ